MNTLKTLIVSGFLAFGLAMSDTVWSSDTGGFSQAELDQMLAPVALYPDTVLSHVLIAATYPLEVVQAARWSRNNPGLKGEQAVDRVERMNWDPSVKALVAFPELLARMDRDLDWTQRLGDAFLMQEDQVVDSIQHLRSDAYAQGNLRSNDHVRVVRETEYIYIEPARPRVVYVPYYDPRVVYGSWRWSSHPPVYWHHPPKFRTGVTFFWGSGFRIAPTFYFSSFHWSQHRVVSVHHHHHHHFKRPDRHFSSGREVASFDGARHWKHNPTHRRGVSYRQGVDRDRFVQRQSNASTARSTNRSASTRSAQPRARKDQRNWATERRANLQLNERSSASRSNARQAVERSQSDSGNRSATRAGASRSTAQRSAQSRPDASTTRSAIENRNERQSRSSSSRQQAGSSRNRADANRGAQTQRRESRPSISRGSQSSSRPAASRREAATAPKRSGQSRSAPSTQRSSTPQRSSSTPQRSRSTSGSAQPSRTTRQASGQRANRSASAPSPRASAPARQSRSESAPQRSAPAQRSGRSQRSAPKQRTQRSASSAQRSGSTSRSSTDRRSSRER